jgi:hypothetical protein
MHHKPVEPLVGERNTLPQRCSLLGVYGPSQLLRIVTGTELRESHQHLTGSHRLFCWLRVTVTLPAHRTQCGQRSVSNAH